MSETTTIGYATMQIIPSLDGVSDAVNKQLGGKLLGVGKQGGKQLAKGVGEGLKDLEREVESASKAYDKFRDKAADALDKITVEEKKLAKARAGGREDVIAAAEARLAKARRDSARAGREAEDSAKSLQGAQRRLGDHTDDLGGRFGNLTGSLRSVGAMAAGTALAGIAALGAAAVVVGRQLYDLGAEFDDLSDSLQVTTGLSGAALDNLSDAVTRLGTTNVPSTFGEIGDVAAEVTRSLHLTGSEFDEVTSRLANLKRMGVDVDIRTLGKAFRGFGIDAKDQASALNSLYDVSTKTGLSIDDLTASITKGGAPLRQLGLDFGESTGLMVAFERAGLDGEKATKALNNAFNYFANEGIPAADGLKGIVAQIRELGDTPQAAELATKVFGGKGGAQFFEAIKSGDLDLQQLQSSLQLTGLDINEVSENTADWSEKWQNLKNEFAVAVEPFASGFFDAANSGLTQFSDYVVAHKTEIIDFFIDVGVGVLELGDTLGQLASSVLRMGANFLEALNAVGLGFKGLFDGLAKVGDVMSLLPGPAGEFGEALSKLGDSMSNFTSEAPDGMRKVADAIDAGRGKIPGLIDGWKALGEQAKESERPTFQWGKKIEEVGDKADTTSGQLDNLSTAAQNFANLPIPGITGPLPGGTNQNPLDVMAGLPPSGGGTPGGLGGGAGGGLRKVGSDAGLLPSTVAIKDQIATQFPDITDIGGYRADPNYPNEHPAGKALDGMIPNWNTPEGKAYGDKVAAAALAMPGVDYVLWQQKQWNKDGTSSPMRDLGNPTANHLDHVHIHNEPSTAGDHSQGVAPTSGQNARPTTSLPTTALPPAPALTGLPSLTAGPGTGPELSAAALNNAFGDGYEPGIGNPGVNEYGDPGYFRVDPKDVREAQQRIDDQMERIRDSDEAAKQAQLAIEGLEVDADEAEKSAAVERKRKADYAAQVARRELTDLQSELGETQKGQFTAAKKAAGAAAGASGSRPGLSAPSSLSGFGSAIGQFVDGQIGSGLGVLGINDSPGWLQGISQFIGGISVSDKEGNSVFDGGNIFGGDAAPVAASPASLGAPPPIEGNAHGTLGGMQPGPVYNTTFNTNDDTAFQDYRRHQNEQVAARLGSR